MGGAMNLLPVRVVPLVSDLPPGALAEQLRRAIGTAPSLPFAGAVGADAFAITRMNEFRSTIMPAARGRLLARPGGGTGVRLRLGPSRTVVAFMGIWLGFLAAVAAMIVLAHRQDAGRSLLPLLAPGGLAALTWYLMNAVFAADARWALEHLVEAIPALRPDANQ
jgi:hypothetical protein